MMSLNSLDILASIIFIGLIVFIAKSILADKIARVKYPFASSILFKFLLAALAIVTFLGIVYPLYHEIYENWFKIILTVTVLFFIIKHDQYYINIPIGYEVFVTRHNLIPVHKETFVRIPTNHYIQIAPGVMKRAVTSRHSMIYLEEHDFKKYLTHEMLEDNYVLFCMFYKNAFFDQHYHSLQETIICVEGEIDCGDIILKAGESCIIPPYKKHIFKSLSSGGGKALILLEKN